MASWSPFERKRKAEGELPDQTPRPRLAITEHASDAVVRTKEEADEDTESVGQGNGEEYTAAEKSSRTTRMSPPSRKLPIVDPCSSTQACSVHGQA